MKSIIKVILVCLMFVGCQKGCTETTPPPVPETPTTDVKPDVKPTPPEVKPTQPETPPTVVPTPDKEKEEEKK